MNTLQDMAHQVQDVVLHVVTPTSPLPSHKPAVPVSRDKTKSPPRFLNVPVTKHSLPSLVVNSLEDGSAEILFAQSSVSSTHTEIPRIDLTLKLLRGNEFPSMEEIRSNNRLQVRISHLVAKVDSNGNGKDTKEKDVPLDSVAVFNRELEVWGGPAYTWNFQGSEDDKLCFSLVEESITSGVTRELGQALASVSELMERRSRNPNRWLNFAPTDGDEFDESSILSLGQIQVRLTEHLTAIIQDQEKCKTISAGPALPSLMTTFKVRKLALWSAAPVMLNIYDVSNDVRIENINYYIKAVGAGGIFHAAIEVHGREYSFGGTRNPNSKITGIFATVPKQCPLHHYRETLYLGDCELLPSQVNGILKDLKPQWLASSYDLFRKNCCFFSRELAIQLGVGDIPEWVYCLAQSAEFLEPYLIGKRTIEQAKTDNAVCEEAASNGSHHPVQKNVSAAPPDHLENIVDHAMAAKIQRTFRRQSMMQEAGRKHFTA